MTNDANDAPIPSTADAMLDASRRRAAANATPIMLPYRADRSRNAQRDYSTSRRRRFIR